MNDVEVTTRVMEMIRDIAYSGNVAFHLDPEDDLFTDLGMTGHDIEVLISDLQAVFEISLPWDIGDEWQTVQGVIDSVQDAVMEKDNV